jgi:hypothetical protein
MPGTTMKPTNFPNGFATGLTVRGMPLLQQQPGQVFWVGNGTTLLPGCVGGANGNPGTYTRPLATVQAAINLCSANTGDIIMVKPGHTETINSATVLQFNKAGVAIVGLGSGTNRPTLTFTTAATANIPLTAANVSIQNFLFVANFADITSVFTATGTATPTDFAVENCDFRDSSSVLDFISIITGNATAGNLNGLRFWNNRISSLGTTAATTAIKLLEACDRVSICNNFGNWAVLNDTAAMVAASTFNQTNFEFGGNILNRPNTSSTGGSFISGSGTAWTGHCYDNYMWQLDNTAGIWIATGTKLAFSQNFSPITGAADRSGLINPAAV